MRTRSFLLVLPTLLLAAIVACTGEGEGQPCDPNANNSGNDDCASPLVCIRAPNANGFRCCPQNLSQATTFECCPTGGAANCSVSGVTVDANPNPPVDATSGADAPAESSADSAPGTPDTGGGTDAAEAAPPADTGAGGAETGAADGGADGAADAAEAASSADGGAG